MYSGQRPSHLYQNLLDLQGLLQPPLPPCRLCLQLVQSHLQLLYPGGHFLGGKVSGSDKLVPCIYHHLAQSLVTTDVILQILQRRKDRG